MQVHNVKRSDTVRSMFDALPIPIIVVDKDVMVQDYNKSAEMFLLHCNQFGFTRRNGRGQDFSQTGEIPVGYLRNLFFRNHYIRYSVKEAFEGHPVVRRCMKLDINRAGIREALNTLFTCSPFMDGRKALMLLIIEMATNRSEMLGLIRICAACHKVIDEKETLAQIETYAQEYMGVRFSHGLCPACFQKELSKLKAYTQVNSQAHQFLRKEVNRSSEFHTSHS